MGVVPLLLQQKVLVTTSLFGNMSITGIQVDDSCIAAWEEIKIKQPTAEYTLRIAKGYYIVRINDTVRKIAIR